MNLPSSVTQEEFLESFNRVWKKISEKYRVDMYDGEDIAQEMFFVALDVAQKYDSTKGPFFNYLSISLTNRVKNFIRDKKSRITTDSEPIDLSDREDVIANMKTTETEFWHTVDENLPSKFRADYIKLRQGIKIPKIRKSLILKEIKKIVDKFF